MDQHKSRHCLRLLSLSGAALVDEPLEITFVVEDVAIAVTRTAWFSRAKPTFLPRTSARCGIVANPGGEWLLVSYQTSAGRLNMTLPFLDLGAPYYLQLRREIDGAVKGVLRSGLTCGSGG